MTSAGSPGSKCCSEKISTDTKNNVGMICRIRLPRKFSMAQFVAFAQIRSLQLQSDYAHEAVGHLDVAFELLSVDDQNLAVEDVEQRLVVEDDLGQLLVDRFALPRIRNEAGFFHQSVGFRIGIAAVVLRCLGVKEEIGIAVGI